MSDISYDGYVSLAFGILYQNQAYARVSFIVTYSMLEKAQSHVECIDMVCLFIV